MCALPPPGAGCLGSREEISVSPEDGGGPVPLAAHREQTTSAPAQAQEAPRSAVLCSAGPALALPSPWRKAAIKAFNSNYVKPEWRQSS